MDTLRSTLREAEVYVKKQSGYKVAKAIHKAIVNLEDWPIDEDTPAALVPPTIYAQPTPAEASTKRETSPHELPSREPAAPYPDRSTTAPPRSPAYPPLISATQEQSDRAPRQPTDTALMAEARILTNELMEDLLRATDRLGNQGPRPTY